MTARPARADDADKLIGLEVLRFMAAFAVLLWHYQHFWYVGGEPQGFERAAQPLYGVFALFYEWGVFGVQVFWAISGFIFFWKYGDAIHAGQVGGWRFFVLRFSRLYPLHIATFVLVAALQLAYQRSTGLQFVYQHNDALHALMQVFMASNWGWQQGDSFNGPIWSVSLEVLAYLLFFCFARAVGQRWWAIGAMALVGAVAFQLKLGHVFQCIFFFFVGGLMVQCRRSAWFQRWQRPLRWGALAYVLGAGLLLAWSGLSGRKLVAHAYIASAAPLLILVLAAREHLSGRVARLAALAGNTTYASYLLHFPVQLALMLLAARTGWQLPRESAWFLLAYLAVSLTLGALAYRAFEMPAQRWLRTAMLGQRLVLPSAQRG